MEHLTKQPYCFEVDDCGMFAFVGLWDGRKDPNGRWVKSCYERGITGAGTRLG